MKWETITAELGHKIYALSEHGRRLLTLNFSSSSKFVRIDQGEERRSFTLRYEGLFRHRMVMRNEYGVRIGELLDEKDKWITLGDAQLHYQVREGEKPELYVYRHNSDKPLAVCQLQLDNEKGILPSVKPTATHHSLLLTLAWYLVKAHHREKNQQLVHNL